VLLLPLDPAPSCLFVLLPTQLDPTRRTTESLPAILARFAAGAEIAHLAHGVFSGTTERDVPGLGTLTTRELEIVGQLLDGNRAPAIAARLFVTPSTVRNHLAAVFAKVGVNSQQQLLNLFRRS
jgi:DNA-binding CsgD family transcriptional regulator